MLEIREGASVKVHFTVQRGCGAGVFLTDCCIVRNSVLLKEAAQGLIATNLHRFDLIFRPRIHLHGANKTQVDLCVKNLG